MTLPTTAAGRPLSRKPVTSPHNDRVDLERIAAPATPLTSAVDLRPLCPPVDDQGPEGSCTGHAFKGAMGICIQRAVNDGAWTDTAYTSASPSRAYIYWCERSIEGDTSQDAGASMDDGLTVIQAGVCSESDMPYVAGEFATAPGAQAVANAPKHAVTNCAPIALDLPTILGTLAQGFPVSVGVTVCQSFEDAPSGNVPMPGASETPLGGHAITLVGYDQDAGIVRFRNSWSAQWGDAGYGTLPLAFLTDTDCTEEAYAIRAVR